MPEFPDPAIYLGFDVPATVLVEAFTFDEPIPPAPVFTPIPALAGLDVRVVLGRAITREVIGCLESAVVADWTEDVELLVPDTASITASSWDPLWSLAGDLVGVSADGRLVYGWDPKGYIVWIEVDGSTVATFMFRSPVDIGDGTVGLRCVDPAAVFSERILGRAEQPDELDDRGSFEDYASTAEMEAAGWVFGDGVTATLVTDGVRGVKALKVTGKGWVSTPKVTLMGADGYGRTVEVGCFAKFASTIPTGTEVIRARAKRISDGAEDIAYRDEKRGGRPDVESGWTDAPITAGARMQPLVVSHYVWADLRSYTGLDTYYDLVTIRQGTTTGAPPGSSQDLTWYVERVLRDLHDPDLGGSPTGLSYRHVSDCGTTATGMRWAHNQRTKVGDVLSMIFDRDGAPEGRITAGWNLEVMERLGSDREDISISWWDLVAPGWAVDPGAQIDDFVVDTGVGSGTSWLASVVSQPVVVDRHRITAMVTAPVDRTLNEIDEWTAGQARAAARLHVTKEATVPWVLASQIQGGDSLWVTDHDGLHGLSRRMRVVTMRWQPEPLLCTIGLGETGG